MRNKRQILFIFLILFSFYSWINFQTPYFSMIEISSDKLKILADIPITIVGNPQLEATATSGNGSKGNPYIIENKIINASGYGTDGISIRNTNLYFILRNCTVTNAVSHRAIHILNVSNARVENNTVKFSDTGIRLFSSYNNTLINNTVLWNTKYGIYLQSSNWTNLTENIAKYNSWQGIGISSSKNNTLIGNIANNGNYGIVVGYSHNITLTGNNANNNGYGISLDFSNDNVITGNTANNNSNGIDLFHSNYTRVIGNILHENHQCIVESGCIGNIIENNDCTTTPIPGFIWLFVLLELIIFILLGFFTKRKVYSKSKSL